MSVIYCAVDGCLSRTNSGLSFFRCPKNELRVRDWKNALGFTGNHKYANLTPEQCNNRIRICSLHFSANCFTNTEENRIHKYATPSLNLNATSASNCINQNSSSTDNEPKNYVDSCIRTEMWIENTANRDLKAPLALNVRQSKPKKSDVYVQTEPIAYDATFGNQASLVAINIEPNEANLKTESIGDDVDPPNQAANVAIRMEPDEDVLKSDPTDDDETLSANQAAYYDEIKIEPNEISFKTDPIVDVTLNDQTANLAIKMETNEAYFEAIDECKREPKTDVTLEDVIKFLEANFSEEPCKLLIAQLHLLNAASKNSRYTETFKQLALNIYFLGPKAYKKYLTVFRLPSISKLECFAKRWVVNPGFNDFIFKVIECRVSLLKGKQKYCVLCLDEIPLRSHLFYDISKDKIVGFQASGDTSVPEIAETAFTIMARGVAGNWKQLIAYFFHKTSATTDDLKDILFEGVRRLRAVGLNVLGVVSSQNSNFYRLVEDSLKLTEDNPSFFVDETRVLYLFDIPDLLKSTRNLFFSYNLKLKEGEIRKDYLEIMYNVDKIKQFKLAPRLTDDHMYPNHFQKTKVQLASQIFSRSVAVAMHTYIDFNVVPKKAFTTANFILKMNDLFDVLNSNTLENFQAFMATEKQRSLLIEMDDLFRNLKELNFKRKNFSKEQKCVFGWRMTIKSIFMLWETLQVNGYNYLFTRNVNQDCMGNFFGQLRNSYGSTMNLTPIQFIRVFKKMFALGYDDANFFNDINEVLLNLTPEFIKNCNDLESMAKPKYEPLKVFTNDYTNIKSREGNALVYLTGYLLEKSLLQHSCEICLNMRMFPFSDLSIQFKDIVYYVMKLESIFVAKFNQLAFREAAGSQLRKELSKIIYIHPCKSFPLEYFLKLYTRVRIYYTLKFINSDIERLKLNGGNIKLDILKTI